MQQKAESASGGYNTEATAYASSDNAFTDGEQESKSDEELDEVQFEAKTKSNLATMGNKGNRKPVSTVHQRIYEQPQRDIFYGLIARDVSKAEMNANNSTQGKRRSMVEAVGTTCMGSHCCKKLEPGSR